MKRCLSERTLLRVHGSDGTVAEREHLRFCADCAERYDRFEEDLDSLRRILDTPPLAASVRHTHAARIRWMPIAATAAALVAVLVGVRAFRQPGAVPVARRSARCGGSLYAGALLQRRMQRSTVRPPVRGRVRMEDRR
jgi:hypothetical protein